MASVQCYKTCEQSCQQKSQQQHGFGQKVSEFFKGHHGHHPNEGTETKTQCYSKTELHTQSGHVNAKGHTEYTKTHTTNGTVGTTTTKCQGKNRRENKRNMFQKIKDGLSGHSSDSNSSSSESDSDNENCPRRKNCN